jgi:H/ACA ribonucleoprotein complex subunit 4
LSQQAPWNRSQKLLTKIDDETDPALGCPPEKRTIDQHIRFGLINLDKPSGPSSHEVVAWVKRLMRLHHAGHGGTLEARNGAGVIQWSLGFFR